LNRRSLISVSTRCHGTARLPIALLFIRSRSFQANHDSYGHQRDACCGHHHPIHANYATTHRRYGAEFRHPSIPRGGRNPIAQRILNGTATGRIRQPIR